MIQYVQVVCLAPYTVLKYGTRTVVVLIRPTVCKYGVLSKNFTVLVPYLYSTSTSTVLVPYGVRRIYSYGRTVLVPVPVPVLVPVLLRVACWRRWD